MAFLRTVADLIRAGAMSTAEFFVRQTTSRSTLTQMLQRRFGSSFKANAQSVSALARRAEQSSFAGSNLGVSGVGNVSDIPLIRETPGSTQFRIGVTVAVRREGETDAERGQPSYMTVYINTNQQMTPEQIRRRALQEVSKVCNRGVSGEEFCAKRSIVGTPAYDVVIDSLSRRF